MCLTSGGGNIRAGAARVIRAKIRVQPQTRIQA